MQFALFDPADSMIIFLSEVKMLKRTKGLWQHVVISIVITVLILCCIIVAISTKKESNIKRVVSVLQEEHLRDYVCRKVTSTVVLRKEDGSSYWGRHYVLVMAEVTVDYGFNLNKITDDDIDVDRDAVNVKLGDPEIIRISVNSESLRSYNDGKISYLNNRHNKDDILQEIREGVPEYFVSHGLLPSRDVLLEKLQRQLKLINFNFFVE